MTDLSRWNTWREIHAQPEIWTDWAKRFDLINAKQWVAAQSFDEVWFCGAGTSAYIGDILVAGLEGQAGPHFRSVPTTDLVSRPEVYLGGKTPLVVNFGRSGNSTETIGTLDVLDALSPTAPRLNITCNPDGALAYRASRGPALPVLLPESTHDAGFAMTSSFSTMLLTALGIFSKEPVFSRIESYADQLRHLLPQYRDHVGDLPARSVFVGTGPLAFAARESALKVMELSAGRIPALWDSTLGFRHGPKSFVTPRTEITVFLSLEKPARDYEMDLARELRLQFPTSRVTTIGPGGDISFNAPDTVVESVPMAVAFAQVAGVVWSDALGLDVDDPFAGQGTLSRVVSGVKLYPVAS